MVAMALYSSTATCWVAAKELGTTTKKDRVPAALRGSATRSLIVRMAENTMAEHRSVLVTQYDRHFDRMAAYPWPTLKVGHPSWINLAEQDESSCTTR